MANIEKNPKALLRQSAIKKIFLTSTGDYFKEPIFHLFASLVEYKDALETVLEEIQKQRSLMLLNTVLDVLYASYSKHTDFEENDQKSLIKAIFACVDINIPATYSKCETLAFQFLQKSANLCCIFPKIAISEFQKQQNNTNMLALYMLILSNNETNDDEILKPIVQQKLSQNFLSYAHFIYFSNHEPTADGPSFKTIISTFKSITDEELFSILATPMIKTIIQRTDANSVKELPSLLSYIPRRLRKDVNGALAFYELLQKTLTFDDSIQMFRPFLEDILSIYLMTLRTTEIANGIDCDDISTVTKKEVGDAFINICAKFEYSPFDTYFQSKADAHCLEVILMMAYVIKKTSLDKVQEKWLDLALPLVPTNKKTAGMAIMVHIAFFYAVNFDSKKGLKFLVQALDCNSSTAAKLLLSNELSFDFVFEEIATLFKPDSSPSLYMQTLITFLKHNFANTPELNQSEKSDIPDSDSNFDLLPRFGGNKEQENEQEIDSTPTTKTILFCSVLTALENNPPLAELLPLTASAISPAFPQALAEKFPKPTQQRFHLDALAAYGNALQALDKTTINALALTFLMLRPDQSMLYLAITLQRLPRHVAESCMKKTLPFAAEYPDICGRMIALVSYAHPTVALNFLSNLINDSQSKRRVFLFFRSSETDEKILIAVLKAIGSCSNFIEANTFINDFLSFATNFLNKHLSGSQLSEPVNEAAFYAIRKLSVRIAQWQSEHSEHVFPFKDFLMQYICSYYLDIGDTILSANEQPTSVQIIPVILNALAALLPLRPQRVSDKELRAIELTAVMLQVVAVDTFPSILKSARLFFCSAIESSPTLSVFIAIANPVFPALLVHSEWRQIAKLLSTITAKWETLSLAESSEQLSKATNALGILISYALPLLISDVGKTAADIVYALHSLGCAIRNQMLSLPRSIRPSCGDLSALESQGLCEAVCFVVAKPLLTPQVYDVILSLIDLFGNTKVLEVHHLGIALAVEQLLTIRGSEEFRFDSQIVKGLCKAIEGKPQEVKDVILRTFGLLFKNRLLSVLSCLFEAEGISDELLTALVKEICQLEKGDQQLLDEIIRYVSSDASVTSAISFSERVLPLLSETIEKSSDEVFAKLISGIFRRPAESRAALIKAVIGENVKAFADSASLKHKKALMTIAQDKIDLGMDISLVLAEADDEICPLYLEPVLANFISSATSQHYKNLEQILSVRSPESYDSLIPQISDILIPRLTQEECYSCAVALLQHCSETQNEVFWSSFAKLGKSKPKEMIPLATKLFADAKPSITAIVPLLPYAVVNEKEDFIKSVAKFLSVKESEDIRQTIEAVLLSEALSKSRADILDSFVGFVKKEIKVDASLHYILILCHNIDDENEFAVEAVVEKLPIALNKESEDIISAIIGILSD